MIVAFDFDRVMSEVIIQSLAKRLIKEGNEIWVVTMRKDNEFNNKIIDPILKKINLTKFNVIYCNDKPKIEMLEMINADIYIDNLSTEFDNILRGTNIVPLLFNY